MNPWKLICGAEILAILAILLLAGGDPHPVAGSAVPATVPARSEPAKAARVHAVDGPASVAAEANAAHPLGTRPWSIASGLVTMLGSVKDETGAPVTRAAIALDAAHSTYEWFTPSHPTSDFLLADLRPGVYELAVTARGFEPWRGSITLRPEPRVQEIAVQLVRGWRIVVWLRTPDGSLLMDVLRATLGSSVTGMRVHVAALAQPATADLRAKEEVSTRTEWADFVRATMRESTLPPGAVGALDVRGEAPFAATVWLDRTLLGSMTIRAGMTEAVLVVDPGIVLESMSRVRLRVVDAQTRLPLAGVQVSLSPPWTSAGPSARSDEGGRVELGKVPPQNLDLELELKGYATGYRELQVNSHSDLDLGDFALHQEGVVRARILLPDGSPMADASVRFFPIEGWLRPEAPRRYSTRTNSDGRFEVRAGAAAYQAILGGRDGLGLQAVTWPRGSADLDEREIVLNVGSAVRLFAGHATTEPRLVWLLDSELQLLNSEWNTGRQPVEWVLAPGDYLLRVEDLDRNLLTTLDLHVPDGGGEIRVALP